MTRWRRQAPSLPKRTVDTIRHAADVITIRRMLDQGAVITPIGPETTLRLPSGGSARFPTALVDEVRHRVLEEARVGGENTRAAYDSKGEG